MRGTDAFRSTSMILMTLAVAACGAQSKAASEPAAAPSQAQPAEPTTSEAAEADPASQEAVGMQFEDRDDGERTERTPPPTSSWKPVDKDKQAKSAREPANR